MNNIYLPEDSIYNKCFVVQSSDIIRAYNVVPGNNRDYQYRDYYINSNYIFRDGSGSWSNYSTLPICLDSSIITHDFYYRNDFDNILIIFLIMSIFIVYLPIKIVSKLFKKGGL